MAHDDMIQKTVQMSLLFDFYSRLLTERQRELFALYYDHDLSLGEIAQEYGVSRQAVYDILRRSCQTLTELEEKLQLVKRHQEEAALMERIDAALSAAIGHLEGAQGEAGLLQQLRQARRDLHSLRSG